MFDINLLFISIELCQQSNLCVDYCIDVDVDVELMYGRRP